MSLNLALLATSGLALILSVISIAMRFWESPPEAMRRIGAIEVDLQEFVDTFTRWMKRENVRRARDRAEEVRQEEPATVEPVDMANRKAQIRRRIAQNISRSQQ